MLTLAFGAGAARRGFDGLETLHTEVGTAVAVKVAVGELVGVNVGVLVGNSVSVAVCVGVLVGKGVLVLVCVGVYVGVAVLVGEALGVLVAVGVSVGAPLSRSKAPISQWPSCGRVTPRWSRLFTGAAAQTESNPASMARLPTRSAIV